ncbi:MAG TPA: phosphatidate cytidylyltransferase [Moraxellaceae bacterium]|nr:phosphatidate cytidylyltransferase [Moraxellaceae bacterium]
MKPELKQRILTAVVLVPVVLWCVFLAPGPLAFRAFAAAIVGVAAWEWAAMMGWSALPVRAAYAALVVAILGALQFLPLAPAYQKLIYIVAVAFWLLAHRLVKSYPEGTERWTNPVFLFVVGLVLLVPAWLGLVTLHGQSAGWLLYLFLLVWGADTGAYFAGRAFGKTRLAPAVSPGKTIEGFLGGLALTMAVAVATALWRGLDGQRFWAFMGLSLLTVLASVLGDLFESMVKRRAGIKDSGRIFPGHGGALDRIDSLTAAAPVFALGWLLAGGF